MYQTKSGAANVPSGASGSPCALIDTRTAESTVFVGTVAGHFGGGALITVPQQGAPIVGVMTDLSSGGALLRAVSSLAASVQLRSVDLLLTSGQLFLLRRGMVLTLILQGLFHCPSHRSMNLQTLLEA